MLESQLLRIFAVAGLAVALVTATLILLHSGVVGGASSAPTPTERLAGSAEPLPAPADVLAAETTASNDSGEAGAPDESGGSGDAVTTSTQPTKTHVVQSGDSFYTIAQKYNTTIARIQQLNPNLDPANLKPGVEVVVP